MSRQKPISADAGRRTRKILQAAIVVKSVVDLKKYIRDIPDFPKLGVIFRDITPLLGDSRAFAFALDSLAAFAPDGVEYVAAVESRGFIFGGELACRLGAGFLPIRKPGKLPWRTKRADYALEYGSGELHIHADAAHADARVMVVDDLIATGGTLSAACQLVEELGATVAQIAVLIELTELGGCAKLGGRPFASTMQL